MGWSIVGHGVSPRLSFPVHDADDIPPARRLSNGSTGTVLVAVAEYCGGSPTDVSRAGPRRRQPRRGSVADASLDDRHAARVGGVVWPEPSWPRQQPAAAACRSRGRRIQPSSPRDRHHPAASGENEERGLTPIALWQPRRGRAMMDGVGRAMLAASRSGLRGRRNPYDFGHSRQQCLLSRIGR